MSITQAYSEPFQTSKMGLFTEIVNGLQPLTIFVKCSTSDNWHGSKYVYVSGRSDCLHRTIRSWQRLLTNKIIICRKVSFILSRNVAFTYFLIFRFLCNKMFNLSLPLISIWAYVLMIFIYLFITLHNVDIYIAKILNQIKQQKKNKIII